MKKWINLFDVDFKVSNVVKHLVHVGAGDFCPRIYATKEGISLMMFVLMLHWQEKNPMSFPREDSGAYLSGKFIVDDDCDVTGDKPYDLIGCIYNDRTLNIPEALQVAIRMDGTQFRYTYGSAVILKDIKYKLVWERTNKLRTLNG